MEQIVTRSLVQDRPHGDEPMSRKTVWWALLTAIALAAILLLNYWAAYQPLSTLAYSGIVLALCGLANLAIPFRFLGIRKRVVGAIIFAGGVGLAIAALLWPAPMFHVAQHRMVLDDIMPEYQFFEKHSVRIHARPEQVMQAVRQSTFGDMKSLSTLMKIRAAALRIHDDGGLQNKQVLNAFSASGLRRPPSVAPMAHLDRDAHNRRITVGRSRLPRDRRRCNSRSSGMAGGGTRREEAGRAAPLAHPGIALAANSRCGGGCD